MKYNYLLPKKTGNIVTVGGPSADIQGWDSAAIQRGIDILRAHGGGTLRLKEGTFDISGPVRLSDNIYVEGSGIGTILKKVTGFKSRLTIDADYGELQAEVQDASGFKPGMGIQVIDDESPADWAVSTAAITSIEGNTIFFDRYLIRDYQALGNGLVSNACSIIEGVEVENVRVANLVIEGSGETNDRLDGCRGGGIYLYKARNCKLENVKVFNFNGDGFSWQITEDISAINCEAAHCTNFGLHPGTGSLRTTVDSCHFHDNGSDGIFVCWRVRESVFSNNRISNNGYNGINIGHKDTDNIFESNHISGNAFSGILVREEIKSNGPHRNFYINNVIEDNGCGIMIESPVEGGAIENNTIRDSGSGVQAYGIRITSGDVSLTITDNKISGHSKADVIGE